MIILGIETTCDETGLALLEFPARSETAKNHSSQNHIPFRLLGAELSSQIALHEPYGGVVPILAARQHKKNLPLLYASLLKKTKISENSIDFIACAAGPGLPPALIEGKNFTIKLSKKLQKPIIPVHHVLAHLHTCFLSDDPLKKGRKKELFLTIPEFPALGCVISGGHTALFSFSSLSSYKKIGETLDDAIGESLDKAARLIGLGYPGGPKIEIYAKKGKPVFTLPFPLVHQKNLNFSFSGLKTAFRELVDDVSRIKPLTDETRAHLARSYQQAVFHIVISKLKRAIELVKPKGIFFGGGVIANQTLREVLKKNIGVPLYFPPLSISTDNGTQIGISGYIAKELLHQKPISADEFDVNPNLPL